MKGGSLMFYGLDEENNRGLKAVLENKKILKLIHDCRNDWDSLLYQYSVRIYNFIDTQEAYFIFKLFHYQEITLPISLLRFIQTMTNAKLEYKDKFKSAMMEDPEMWAKRPLTSDQLSYASEDVIYLFRSWQLLREKFNENLTEIVSFLTILKVVDFTMFNQFKEYLVANVIYFGMLENVFSTKEVCAYLFNLDYIYSFLQIRMNNGEIQQQFMKEMVNSKRIQHEEAENQNSQLEFPVNEEGLLPIQDEEYYKFLKEESKANSIINSGINFRRKQRILSLKHFKEEEIIALKNMKKSEMNSDMPNFNNPFAENIKPNQKHVNNEMFFSQQGNKEKKHYKNYNYYNSQKGKGEHNLYSNNINLPDASGNNNLETKPYNHIRRKWKKSKINFPTTQVIEKQKEKEDCLREEFINYCNIYNSNNSNKENEEKEKMSVHSDEGQKSTSTGSGYKSDSEKHHFFKNGKRGKNHFIRKNYMKECNSEKGERIRKVSI
jgi:hypothetical protein